MTLRAHFLPFPVQLLFGHGTGSLLGFAAGRSGSSGTSNRSGAAAEPCSGSQTSSRGRLVTSTSGFFPSEAIAKMKDELIAWPPVVVIENLGLGIDPETMKNTGLDNKEIRSAVEVMVSVAMRRVLALYDHNGHTGRAFVVFPDNEVGYLDAIALHDAFKDRRKGRDDLRLATPQEKECNGKKELFGYLATPNDMTRLDRRKNAVKRWSVEAFNDKVKRPQLEKQQEAEENKLARAELERTQGEKAKELEMQEQDVKRLRRELDQANAVVQAENCRQEAIRESFEKEKEERRLKFEAELRARKEAFHCREQELRGQIARNREAQEAELEMLMRQTRSLEGDIVKQGLAEKELKLKVEAYERDLKRGITAEEVRMRLKDKHLEEVAELKKTHQEQLKERMRELVKKKQQLNSRYEEEQKILDGKIHAAEDQCREIECAVCMEEFVDRPRALYAACGHARICLECAESNWRNNNRKCPICNKEQSQKPKEMPERLYY